jgi:hypothetical protein
MASPSSDARLVAILTRLSERTERAELNWEAAAPPDSFAVTVGEVRFRVRSRDGDGAAPFVLEFLGQVPLLSPALMTGGEPDEMDTLIERLYHSARQAVIGSLPDPFESVEKALGIEPPASED